MSSNNTYYVYAYLRNKDSKTAKAGTPYYIGKGTEDRILKPHGKTPIPTDKSFIIFLEQNLNEIGAFAIERRMIAWYGRKDNKTGILNNRTDGGEGVSGVIRSAETRDKISKFQSGRKKSEETKQKMRKPKSESHRANMGRPHSEEAKAKMREHKHTTESKLKMMKPKEKVVCPCCGKIGGINGMKRYHFENCGKPKISPTVEQRAKISAKLKGRIISDAVRINMKAGQVSRRQIA
jgi:hypothetical protein